MLHYDARDPHRATAVEALTDSTFSPSDVVALEPRRRPLPDVAYGRAVDGRDGRTWLQYWLLYEDNEQDRGIVRTGRHEGDWELVQVGLGRDGRPAAATFSQHAWGADCAWTGHVFVANGSHASYASRGEHGRPWPDPDDEARGDGRTVRPRVERFGTWVDFRGRWGRSEPAWWIPGESSSPPGPAFQSSGAWRDPARWHARARACSSGAPPHPWPVYAGLFAFALLGAILARWLKRAR